MLNAMRMKHDAKLSWNILYMECFIRNRYGILYLLF